MLSVGYLNRVPDPDDGRQAKLSITPSGRALHDAIAKTLVTRQEEVLDALDDSERQEFQRLLQKLALHTATLDR